MSKYPSYIEIYLRESLGKETRDDMRRALGMNDRELSYHIKRIEAKSKPATSSQISPAIGGVLPSKANEQKRLDEDKARFFAAGGKITKVPGFTEVRRKS